MCDFISEYDYQQETHALKLLQIDQVTYGERKERAAKEGGEQFR